MSRQVKTFEDEDGVEHSVPTKREVCPACEGHGTHLTPSIRDHAYSTDEFNESFDEEEQGEYFKRGGMYDVTCEECNGKNIVDVVDEELLKQTNPTLYQSWLEHEKEMAEMYACEAAERRMGA